MVYGNWSLVTPFAVVRYQLPRTGYQLPRHPLAQNRFQTPPDVLGNDPFATDVRVDAIALVQLRSSSNSVEKKRKEADLRFPRHRRIRIVERGSVGASIVRQRLHLHEQNPRLRTGRLH